MVVVGKVEVEVEEEEGFCLQFGYTLVEVGVFQVVVGGCSFLDLFTPQG